MMEWTGQFGWATIIALATFCVVVAGFIKGVGIREADMRNLGLRSQAVEEDVEQLRKDIVEVRRERDNFVVSVNHGVSIYRDQMSDIRREMVANHPTKSDLKAVEERTSQGFDRVFKMLDRIDGKLDTMNGHRTS